LIKRCQPDILEKIIFFNKKFKVIFRHAYTLLDQVLQTASDPAQHPQLEKAQERLKQLLD
jgi:hypothetical protein